VIGRLQGELLEKQAPYLLLNVNGVGYELEAPMSTFYELPECGESVMLHTHLLVREDAQTLAERLILDMRDRLEKEVTAQIATNGKALNGVNGHAQDPVADAVSALVSLGYKPNEASRMVGNVDTKNDNSEDIIRQALKSSMS